MNPVPTPAATKAIYPNFTVNPPQNPNKLYAIPLIGLLIKGIMLIPAYFFFLVLALVVGIMNMINAFVVLFTGKYWPTAYTYNLGLLRYMTKMNLFMFGVTDKYPGFNLEANESFSLNVAMPQNPNRMFAIPLVGILVRSVLLIPMSLFQSVFSQAAAMGVFLVGWIFVLFQGKYPEALFEMVRDTNLLTLRMYIYNAGLSDQYPSFKISWNHKNVKIALMVIAGIYLVLNFIQSMNKKPVPPTPKTPSFNYSTSYTQ